MPPAPTTLNTFLHELSRHDTSELIFCSGALQIQPGYHVTELKAVTVESIDCGARRDQWVETQVVLLDGSPHGTERMRVETFRRIAGQSLKALPQLADAPLFFEFNSQRARPGAPTFRPGQALVPLLAENAVCKPMQRRTPSQPACCAS